MNPGEYKVFDGLECGEMPNVKDENSDDHFFYGIT